MMTFDEIRSVAAKLESDIANGPIVPTVTPDEIRRHLAARYDFTKPLGPDEVGADTLVAMYNPQLATWRTSPAANEIERHTLAWLSGKFGLPPTAIASFTSGGAEANLSAVVVALTRAFPSYGPQGLRGLSASPTLYLTGEAHHSFSKIAHMTG